MSLVLPSRKTSFSTAWDILGEPQLVLAIGRTEISFNRLTKETRHIIATRISRDDFP